MKTDISTRIWRHYDVENSRDAAREELLGTGISPNFHGNLTPDRAGCCPSGEIYSDELMNSCLYVVVKGAVIQEEIIVWHDIVSTMMQKWNRCFKFLLYLRPSKGHQGHKWYAFHKWCDRSCFGACCSWISVACTAQLYSPGNRSDVLSYFLACGGLSSHLRTAVSFSTINDMWIESKIAFVFAWFLTSETEVTCDLSIA